MIYQMSVTYIFLIEATGKTEEEMVKQNHVPVNLY